MKKGRCGLNAVFVFLILLVSAGCATPTPNREDQTLRPPEHADPIAAQALLQGNSLFAEHQWTAAKRKFEAAIQAQPTLAEAHYNLALTLEQQGRLSESRPLYKKAADLAPGHPVILNAPPFRQYRQKELEPVDQVSDGHSGHQH
jgi:Tfp pilus assembly protein PilF